MNPRLSILIATMPKRKRSLARLLKSLPKNNPQVEILTDDSMDYNIGEKRNKLLLRATGDFITYIDDDDSIYPNYVELILKATSTNPDCIGICGIITTNGLKKKKWFISKDYWGWFERDSIYYRTPNHISPVKREIALKAMFPQIKFGEDAEYSKRILPFLHTEVKIDEEIYHYQYSTRK